MKGHSHYWLIRIFYSRRLFVSYYWEITCNTRWDSSESLEFFTTFLSNVMLVLLEILKIRFIYWKKCWSHRRGGKSFGVIFYWIFFSFYPFEDSVNLFLYVNLLKLILVISSFLQEDSVRAYVSINIISPFINNSCIKLLRCFNCKLFWRIS